MAQAYVDKIFCSYRKTDNATAGFGMVDFLLGKYRKRNNIVIIDAMLTEDGLFYMVEEDNANNYLQLETIGG